MRLIDADALLEDEPTEILEYFDGYCKFGYSRRQIEEAPTIDPVKHGKWVEHEWAEEYDGRLINNYECSECKMWVRDKTPFCPYCGLKME